MGRTVAVIWHASFSLAAGVLYFFFVLPRTPELMGQTSHTLGTAIFVSPVQRHLRDEPVRSKIGT